MRGKTQSCQDISASVKMWQTFNLLAYHWPKENTWDSSTRGESTSTTDVLAKAWKEENCEKIIHSIRRNYGYSKVSGVAGKEENWKNPLGLYLGTATTRSKCYRVQMLQDTNVTGFKCYGVQMLQGPNITGSKCYRVQTLQGPNITGSCSERWLCRGTAKLVLWNWQKLYILGRSLKQRNQKQQTRWRQHWEKGKWQGMMQVQNVKPATAPEWKSQVKIRDIQSWEASGI